MQRLSSKSTEVASLALPADPSLVSTDATSRRSFLSQGLAVAAVPAGLLGATSLVQAAAPATGVPSYFPGSTTKAFQEIQVDEYDHVNFLKNTIISLGGTPRPTPTFVGISNLTTTQFITLSQTFENTGVGAYLGAVPYVQNPAVLMGAAQIALVEAYHAGFLNVLNGGPLIPQAAYLAQPIELAQILSAIAPFVSNLNDNGQFPPVYGSTPSATNDIAILNFALLLEFLEATFYYNNVPNLNLG
jgi:hypothetical protein